MRLVRLASFTKKLTPPSLAILLLLALSLSTSFSDSSNKESSSPKVQNEKNSAQSRVLSETDSVQEEVKEETAENPQSIDENAASSTSVNVSVQTNTTNDETTGSTNISITNNGKTETFHEEIKGDETTIKGGFKFRIRQDSDNDVRVSSKIKSTIKTSD